jgi:N-methylhydantoinase A
MPLLLGVDIGGTFTDLVGYNSDTGALHYTKSPTTYEDLRKAVFSCIKKAGLDVQQASLVKHGTTLVINALLQRRGARTALVTTKGFKDTLEIGRGNRTRPYDLRFQRTPPLVDRPARLEVSERISSAGEILVALDLTELEALASTLRDQAFEAVAVSFVNAYANPVHERAAVEFLRDKLDGTFVCCGSELSQQFFEFERTATAVSNAFVGPQVGSYVSKFRQSLRDEGFEGPLLLMGSHGGALSADRACREPIALVESGPVGGCIGAARYASTLGLEKVIAFDMGGTTAKSALIENGGYLVDSIYYVGGWETGFPIRSNVIDIFEVGAGGGSIAYVDSVGRMHVGPKSAGSTPGPACYGRGGDEPTVTDANLILGRLNPDHFLGGEMSLDAEAARSALCKKVADPLSLIGSEGVIRAADGVIRLASLSMAESIKQVSVGKGRDPRQFVLFCYGGGGPLHGAELARELKIPTVIVPAEPGNFSATGMLMADARVDASRTYLELVNEDALADASAMFKELETSARDELRKEFGNRTVSFERSAELRYRGQLHTIRVQVRPDEPLAQLLRSFEQEYTSRYGHLIPGGRPQFVALHCGATLAVEQPPLVRPQLADEQPQAGEREVYFLHERRFFPTTVYNRYALPPGFASAGPAVIEEYGSSTLVGPNDRFVIGALGEIRIECDQ